MNLSEIFIRRPVMTILLMVALLLFGIMGYLKLPVSSLPNVDYPTIVVSANLPGASPITMASSVATPLEQQLATIAGIDSMTSSSALGMTQITLQFNLNRNIDGAALDVQSAISVASKQLPANMPFPPSFKKVNPADAPVLYLSMSSKTERLSTVDYYAETLLAQQISMINGVAQVNVYGSQKYAVRVQVDPAKLAAENLSLNDVHQAVANGNVNLPVGSLLGKKQNILIQSNGQLMDAPAYRPLIITYRKGAAVRLQDVGDVIDSVQNNQVASWHNGVRTIVLAIQRQPGVNTVEVVNNIKKILPRFETQMPKSIHLTVIYDRSPSILAAVKDVQHTLIIAMILVVLVIFLFLKSAYATIIPSLALPLSIVGTFAFMSHLNFSLDIISLMALTLTVGFVVDDAIVMLENIMRHIEEGKKPLEAALIGSKEISFTILSMTLSLIAVFIPLLFMAGLLGRLFHEFAVTTCIVILLSGVISIVLTPMLASRLLKPHVLASNKRWYDFADKWFEKWQEEYKKGLQWVLDHQRFTLGLFFLSIMLTAILYVFIPKGFLPSSDTGQLIAYTEATPGIGFSSMVEKQQIIAGLLQKHPEVESVMSSVGAGGASSTSNTGRIFLALKPWASRSQTADEILNDLRLQLTLHPIMGLNVYLQNVPSLNIGGRLTKSTYQYTMQASKIEELQKWMPMFQNNLQHLPALIDVTNDMQTVSPAIYVKIDRDKASTYGITAYDVENTLSEALSTQQISTIYADVTTYEVIMEVLPSLQENPNVLSQLYIRSSSGELVPLTAIATLHTINQPLTVNHQGQLPAATLSFNLKPGYSLSDAVNEIDNVKNRLHPPETIIAGFQGTAQAFKATQQSMLALLIIAIIVIYIILGILYESFIHPLTILSGLPSAGVGALLALILFNMELDLYGFIGIIMLMGIVKKNAIMMIDFALAAKRHENKSSRDAIFEACLIRFRPIMMTTIAALFGTLPIALALGQSAQSIRPLGIAVVGGLLISQILTLFITPVIFLYLDRFSKD